MVCGGAPPLHLPLSREGLLSLSLLRRFLPTASLLHYETPLGRVTVPTLLTPAGLTVFVITHPAALHTATLGHPTALHHVCQGGCSLPAAPHPAVMEGHQVHQQALVMEPLGEALGRLQAQVDQMKVQILQLHLEAVVARARLQEREDRVKLLRNTIKLIEGGDSQEEEAEKLAEIPASKKEGSAGCSTVNDENNNVKEEVTSADEEEKDTGTKEQARSGPKNIVEHKQEKEEKEHDEEQENKVCQENKENRENQVKKERLVKEEVQDGILTIRPKLKRFGVKKSQS